MKSLLWLLLCICLTTAERSHVFNRAIQHFEISSTDSYKFIASCGNETFKLDDDLIIQDSYPTHFSPPNSTFVYVDDSYVVECGTASKCCINNTLDTFNEVIRSSTEWDKKQCIDLFNTTHETAFYPFSFEFKFFVLTSYLPTSSAAARYYFSAGPEFVSRKMLGGGRGDLPIVISPPSRLMDKYAVCLRSQFTGVVQYYEPTKDTSDSIDGTNLKCDGLNQRGSSGTALPAQSNALKISKSVINYLSTAHFVNFHDEKSRNNKLCVYTENEFAGSELSKNNLFELTSTSAVSAMDVVVVNEELCLYYAISEKVYKVCIMLSRCAKAQAKRTSTAHMQAIIVLKGNSMVTYVTKSLFFWAPPQF